MPRPPWLIRVCGGRKFFNGYVGVVMLTVMAFFLKASYEQYALYLCLLLGFTAGTVAWEDRAKHANGHVYTPEEEANK